MLLNCHSYYSFCYGIKSIEELLNEVKAKGYEQFALTDINNTSGCLNAIRMGKEMGLHVVVGVDFRNKAEQNFVALAKNNQGFKEINDFLSVHLHEKMKFPRMAPEFNNVWVIYPLHQYDGQRLRENEFVGVSAESIRKTPLKIKEIPINKRVIMQTMTFTTKKDFNAHRLLRAVENNVLLSKLDAKEHAKGDEKMYPKDELFQEFRAYPEILINTEKILNECRVGFTYGKLANKNLKYYTGDAETDMAFIKSECLKGLGYRYSHLGAEVIERLEKELLVIGQMNFASYYLINWDIIKYAKSKQYYHVGRGSGANSLVAYLLGITDVDPIELDLYFERFINIYRSNAPDFDIDFSWTDRDDITAYIFKRFGYERTAMLGAYSTFQSDAAIREIGKVFGLPSVEIDKLQQAERNAVSDEVGKWVLNYSKMIEGFPSHLTVHSSGIIISELPITQYSATILPPKGFPTTQFSMLEAEDIGLIKFDILSQRGLGKIKDCLEIVKEQEKIEIDIHQISSFKKDEKVKKMLREGGTMGCFYVESPAMRMLLIKLKADDYLRLVAASSIIRPGVAKSGMMRQYVVRFRDKKEREKARQKLPELYDILEETYGVMVYQEDVIKVAHLFAGLSLAEADYLRRGMSWKFKERNEFKKVKHSFYEKCIKKGYELTLIEDIWNQIESFGNFAFSKGHSASYAVESYQAMYLKAHYPIAYMMATVNNGGGFYRAEFYLHEAKKWGAKIQHPCVNISEALCVLRENNIYLGFCFISEITSDTIEKIAKNRSSEGKFLNLQDFVERVDVGIEQIRQLIKSGAFAFTGKSRKALMWELHGLFHAIPEGLKKEELFKRETKRFSLPDLEDSEIERAFDELELFGFTLSSPSILLRDQLPGGVGVKSFKEHLGKFVQTVGYLVTVKSTRTSGGEKMGFGTFLDKNGDWIDTVHFPQSMKKNPFMGRGYYQISGALKEEFGYITLEVSEMKRLPWIDREKI